LLNLINFLLSFFFILLSQVLSHLIFIKPKYFYHHLIYFIKSILFFRTKIHYFLIDFKLLFEFLLLSLIELIFFSKNFSLIFNFFIFLTPIIIIFLFFNHFFYHFFLCFFNLFHFQLLHLLRLFTLLSFILLLINLFTFNFAATIIDFIFNPYIFWKEIIFII
jgi:hypothetical protein